MRPLNISGSQAKDYYYDKDVLFGSTDNSRWHGDIADRFDLSGCCDERHFLNLISGNDPDGRQIVQDGVNGEHRAAIDIPFSAPKSVSVMALHVGDNALIDAHEKAVANTIAYIEKNYMYARETIDGKTMAFKTENGLFATFNHATSRANDPHLHTHTLTFNMTRTSKGWRALFNDHIFKDQTLLNYVYQSELAKNIRELGYEISNNEKGRWEIAGFEPEWIKQFSTRSKEIDDALDASGVSLEDVKENGAKARDRAQKSSRSKKDAGLSYDELYNLWQEKVDRKKIAERIEKYKINARNNTAKDLTAGDFVKIAYNAIHENESTFIRQDVVKIGLELSRGQCTVGDIEQAFYQAVKSKEIEHLKSHINKKGVETSIFASQDMRLTEQGIVKAFNRHKEDLAPVVSRSKIKDMIRSEYGYFTCGQQKVVEQILLSQSRFVIIQGDSGTGKTSALEALNHILKQQAGDRPIEITGLGYTGKAALEIENKAGINSQTLHRFLNQKNTAPSENPKIWVVDESSMVGSRQMKAVMEKALSQDAKVVFIGDGKQLQAISAGRMFKDLQHYKHVETIRMEEVLRQKTDYMKKAVNHVKQFQDGKSPAGIDEAFAELKTEKKIKTIPNRSRRIKASAAQFMDRIDHQNTLIITPVNEDRVEINEILHTALKPLDQDELNVEIRSPAYLNGTSKYFARNYAVGQKAFIEQSHIAGFRSGQEAAITGVDVENNQLTLSGKTENHTIDLKSNDVLFSVYNVEQRSFFEGEKIVFFKNDKKLGLTNGQTATIEKIGPERVITAKIDGQDKATTINLDFYPYLDRGYAVTVHKSQGQTAKEVVFVTDTKNPLNKTETFYVALSRAENNFTLIADKPDELKAQFKQAQPKTSVMDFVKDNFQKELSQPLKSIQK